MLEQKSNGMMIDPTYVQRLKQIIKKQDLKNKF
jgi:hypothetical protein